MSKTRKSKLVWGGLRETFRFGGDLVLSRVVVASAAVFFAFSAAGGALTVVYLARTLHVGPLVGVVTEAATLGAVLAAVVAHRLADTAGSTGCCDQFLARHVVPVTCAGPVRGGLLHATAGLAAMVSAQECRCACAPFLHMGTADMTVLWLICRERPGALDLGAGPAG
jgi:hypothetical protein